jgi:Tol biopolymer transport system component
VRRRVPPHALIAQPGDERYPSISPDGTRLAFTTRPTASDDVAIAVAEIGGGGATALTENAEFDSSPSWSPDGRIAFECGPAGDDPGNDVWSMAADGTDQRRLTTTAGLDEGPAWSPSGSRIAFSSTRSGSSDIWTMAADGTDQRPLADGPGKQESPDWQPLGVAQ